MKGKLKKFHLAYSLSRMFNVGTPRDKTNIKPAIKLFPIAMLL